MATLQIDCGDLLFALGSHDTEHYLDLETGVVIPIFEDVFDDEQPELDLEDGNRYRFIEPVPSHEGFEWMESFARRQQDGRVRADLLAALERRRPFRSFKDALASYPEVRTRWFEFEEERLLQYAREWLLGEGIQAELVVPAAPDLPPV